MSFDDLITVHRIDIKVILTPVTSEVAATDILPLQLDGEKYDKHAVALYDEFIMNILAIFDYYDFVILEEHQSPYTKSEYYTLVKKSQYEAQDYRYVLFIRISDHETEIETKKSKMRYYSAVADEIKQPVTKRKQVWRLKEIIVNNQHYASYEEALEDIDRRLSTTGN
jgi:hypothetical protein